MFYTDLLGVDLLFRVDNLNPTMLTHVIEVAWFKSSQERSKIIEEMEVFAKREIEKLNNNF
ncbi:hypothetical protein CQ046_17785 [Chryseobacterium sp. MYb7]|nr:hypothetical protein CQ046_17785 [Chryseobacterium sp. MYb7]